MHFRIAWMYLCVPILSRFFRKKLDFPANHQNFCKLHRDTLENSKVRLTRRCVRRTETYPILKTFLFSIGRWRFGGVGVLEGHKKVPDHIFRKLIKIFAFGGRLRNQAISPQNMQNISAKIVKIRVQTCNSQAVVVG
jgi:hypothetical protein